MYTTAQQSVSMSLRLPAADKRSSLLQKRSDSEWLSGLAGEAGPLVQQQANEDLSAYLFVVVLEYLHKRQLNTQWLSTLDEQELVALVQDTVQTCLEKLSADGYVRLKQFTGQGAFTSWAAQVALNEIRSELRLVRWHRLQPIDTCLINTLADDTPAPDAALQHGQLQTTLDQCMAQLPDQYRTVLERCVMHGEKPADVAEDLGRSAQSIYNLISRGKARLGHLLEQRRVDREDLWELAG